MERGIYFDGWYKNNHCYHPSLPMRSTQMIDDLEKYKGTILVWSALGGGSISLPYLEHEAFGEVDPRLRFYGFMNDSEFIAECNKRGIKVFSIVFEVQGWEFPAAFDEKGNFKALNVVPEGETQDWYGLREFSNGKHNKAFKTTLKDYFPDGIINSAGETVTDLWTECAAVDYNGTPIHAQWVEVVGHKHICYQTCRNNPVWRTYLKKIMEIQIDAGVPGIQLDECELPITSLRHGGCFCRDCRSQFTEHLKELRSKGKLPHEYDYIELDGFDYGEFLKSRRISFPADDKGVPLFRQYWEFQLRAVKKYFTELVDFAKKYGMDKYNREILVSGNFFNLMPVYFPIENTVDVVITEMEKTLFRQPYWYRYVAGFSGNKPVIVAENPYGGIIPELLNQLDKGIGYDLYRIFLLEASAYGCNMSVPYGGWMGNTIKDAFYPPRDVTEEIQTFLADNESLFAKASGSNTVVLYSWQSNYWTEATKASTGNVEGKEESILFFTPTDINDPKTSRQPFWESIKALSDEQVIYDVKMLADGDLREDDFALSDLEAVELLVLPDCHDLTQNQVDVLYKYAESGRKLFILGRVATNLTGVKEMLSAFDNVVFCNNPENKTEAISLFKQEIKKIYSDVWQVKVSNPDVGVQLHKSTECNSIHIINYNYDSSFDAIMDIPSMDVQINMPIGDIKIHTHNGRAVEFEKSEKDGITTITLKDMPLYTAIEFQSMNCTYCSYDTK